MHDHTVHSHSLGLCAHLQLAWLLRDPICPWCSNPRGQSDIQHSRAALYPVVLYCVQHLLRRRLPCVLFTHHMIMV